MLKNIILTVLVMVAAGLAQAETIRYVNDEIVITLRAGQGDEYRIIRTLSSGTSMVLLEKSDVFSKVRLSDGVEGWVRGQYLVKEPIARLKLNKLTAQFERMSKDHEAMKLLLEDTTKERDSLLAVRKNLEKQSLHLAQENSELEAIAARPMEIERQNNKLLSENQRLTALYEQAHQENESLRNSTVQKWFLVGAGVLLLGMFAGLLLPKFGRRRGSTW